LISKQHQNPIGILPVIGLCTRNGPVPGILKQGQRLAIMYYPGSQGIEMDVAEPEISDPESCLLTPTIRFFYDFLIFSSSPSPARPITETEKEKI
jgi:hypothetical protein